MRAADVIALTTGAPEPVIRAEWVKPGAHVSSVGYHPPRGELPRELAERGHLFVETRAAFAPPPVGCAELAGLDAAGGTELGELVAGTKPGRRSAEEITSTRRWGTSSRTRWRRSWLIGGRWSAVSDGWWSSSRRGARGRSRAGRRRP